MCLLTPANLLQRMMAIGSLGAFISVLICAFSTRSLAMIFVFQGLLVGISQGLILPLFMSMPSQWFLRRRGLASGIVMSGSGFGGGFATLIVRQLITKVGVSKALFIWSFMQLAAFVVGWLLVEVRVPVTRSAKSKPWLPTGIWNKPEWWSLLGCICIGIFGFIVSHKRTIPAPVSHLLTSSCLQSPYALIAAYSREKLPQYPSDSIIPTLPLTVMSFSSGFGRVFAGFLADLIGPVNTLFLSFFLGGLFQIVIWSFATSLGSILVFGILNGFAGSWFLSLIPPVVAQLFGTEGLATSVGFVVLSNSPGKLPLSATANGRC